ncbi:MAG: ABC transporter ATP-binding protein [Gammaproteobacteria bacterium]
MNNTNHSHVVIDNLHFAYNDHSIFNGIDIVIPRGKIVAIMGPSGAGKSTLLRLIGGQLKPTKGMITVNDTNIHKLSSHHLYKMRREMSLLFQSGALFTNLNVFDNVAFPLREHSQFSESLIRTLVLLKLQIVGLRGARHLATSELSGGMARRVALARAIALDPKLIMYDEPFTGLDPISMGVIVRLIHCVNRVLGMTTIIVSHDVQEVVSIADYIYVISEGKLIGSGTSEQLCKDETPAVKQFMQGLPDGVVPFNYPACDLYEDLLTDD